MVQKVTEVVGISKESFAKAAESAVAAAAKTLRGLKWAEVTNFTMALNEDKVLEYRATVKIYFDLER
jgi:hypothetical protein